MESHAATDALQFLAVFVATVIVFGFVAMRARERRG
jgi:hypothetical protein